MESGSADGLLLVDKAIGMTSHDAVALARRALRTRRIGHAGTLDPFASGLLVMLVGRATRLLPYLDGEPKVYEATIRFGAETDTADPTGVVVREAPLPDAAAVDRAIIQLTGEIEQIPPVFSAKKVGGVRAYAAARRGEAVALAPTRIVVHGWSIRARRAEELDVEIVCGGGTYVRALARDLGALAGSAAHLVRLRRTRSGPFSVDDATSTDALAVGARPLRPSRDAVSAMPVQVLADEDVVRIARGMTVSAELSGDRCALVDVSGTLVALAERRGDAWQPKVVLRGE
jgi:tRNA pseudouridine55 synthase